MINEISSRKIKSQEATDRLNAAKQTAEIMKLASFANLSLPENQMDSISLLVTVKKLKPKLPYCNLK
jgi:hypothetical protein